MRKIRNFALAFLAVFAIPLFAACGETVDTSIPVYYVVVNDDYSQVSMAMGASLQIIDAESGNPINDANSGEPIYTVMPTETTMSKAVTLSTSNSNVVSISEDGTAIIAVSAGTADISVTSQSNPGATAGKMEITVVGERETLSTPTGLVYDGNTLSWNDVVTTSSFHPSYRLDITRNGEPIEPVTVNTNSYDALTEGHYIITVTALGNGIMYDDSSASESLEFTKLAAPSELKVTTEGDLSTGAREFTLSFKLAENTDSIDDYNFEMHPTASSLTEAQDEALWSAAFEDAHVLDGYAYIKVPEGLSNAANILTIYTLSTDSGVYGSGLEGGANITISKLSTPQNLSVANVTVSGERERQLTWRTVSNASQYKIVVRYAGGTPSECVDMVDAGTTMYNLLNMPGAPSEGSYSGYEVYVYAIGSTSTNIIYIDSDSSVSAMMQLDAVADIRVTKEESLSLYEINWSGVNNAAAYAVYISSNNNSTISTTDRLVQNDTSTRCEIDFYAENLWNVGNNYLKIVSLATVGSNYSDSVPAIYASAFIKLATISDFRVSYGELAWSAVDNATEYVISFGEDVERTIYVEDNTTQYTYVPTDEDLPVDGVAVTIYARNTNDTQAINSNVSETLQLTRFEAIGSKYINVVDGQLEWEMFDAGDSAIPTRTVEVEISDYTGERVLTTITVSNPISILDTLASLNLSDRYYTFRIRPVNNTSEGLEYINGDFSSPIRTYQMETPTGLSVVDGVITWNNFSDETITSVAPAHGGIRYAINVNGQVYTSQNGQFYGINTTSAVINGLSDSTRYNISIQVTIDTEVSNSGRYPLTIDENTYIINSQYSDTITARVLPRPTGLSVRDYTLSWNSSSNSTNNYLIQLYSLDSDGVRGQTPLWSETVTPASSTSPSYNFSTVLSNDINFVSGRYEFLVYALGGTGTNDAYITSYVSSGLEIYKLDTPELQVSKEGSVYWNPVYSYLNGNSSQILNYTLYVTNADTGEQREYNLSSTSSTLSDIPAAWYGHNLELRIQARSSINLIYDSEISSIYQRNPNEESDTQVTVQKLDTLKASDITVNGNVVTWTADSNSGASYVVTLYNAETNENLGTTTVHTNSYTMPNRNGGKYSIRIQRVGYQTIPQVVEGVNVSYRYIDSEFSEAINFMRYYDPTGLQLSVNEDREPILTWKVAQDNENSRFKVTIVSLTDAEVRYEYYIDDYNTKTLDLYNTQSETSTYFRNAGAGSYAIYISTVMGLRDGEPITTITESGITYYVMESRSSSAYNATIFEAPTFNVNGSTLEFTSNNAFSKGMQLIFTPLEGEIDNLTEVSGHDIEITLQSNVTSYEIEVGNFTAGTFYKVQIKALGNSSNLIDSAWEVNESLVYKLEPLNANTVAPEFSDTDGSLTNQDAFDGWYVQNGNLYWPSIEGVQTYSVYLVSDNSSIPVVEVNDDGRSQPYESSVSGIEFGAYGLQFRLAGGKSSDEAMASLGDKQYYVAYLSSDASQAVMVNKLYAPNDTINTTYNVAKVNGDTEQRVVDRSTAYSKITTNGEFDFGIRNEQGIWTDNSGATEYRLTINDSDWVIPYDGLNTSKEEFIASETFVSNGRYDIRLYSVGNTWYGTNDSTNEYIYLTSDAGSTFTIIYGGKIDDLQFDNGAIVWDDDDAGSTSGYDLEYTTDVTSTQMIENLNVNSFSFVGYDDVKGSLINGIKVRFSGNDTSSGAMEGYVNSEWSSELNNVYKLADLVNRGQGDAEQYLYINDKGQLAWETGNNFDGIDNLQMSISRTVMADGSVVNAPATENVDLVDEAYNVPAATGVGEIQGALIYDISAYILGTRGQVAANNNIDEILYLDSDEFALSASKLNTPVSFTLDTENGSVRINWDLTGCSTTDSSDSDIEADEIVITYRMTGENYTKELRLDVAEYSTINGIIVTGNIPFWTLGTFNDIQLTVVNSQGLAFGSAVVPLNQTSVEFDYFYSGSGTRDDPFVIQDKEGYTALQQLEMTFWLPDVYFRFGQDIELPDLSVVQETNPNATSNIPYPAEILDRITAEEFDDYSSLTMLGGWDGDGHTISNYQVIGGRGYGIWSSLSGYALEDVEQQEEDAFHNWAGVITDLNVEVNTIDLSEVLQIYNGIIVQSCYGLIYNCNVSGDPDKVTTGGLIESVFQNAVNIIDYPDPLYFGGIAGMVSVSPVVLNPEMIDPNDWVYSGELGYVGRIENCTNTLDMSILSGTGVNLETHVGGIVGQNVAGYVINCTNGSSAAMSDPSSGTAVNNHGNVEGFVSGGIAGEVIGMSINVQTTGEDNQPTIVKQIISGYLSGCVNYGTVTGTSFETTKSASGGIVGRTSDSGYVMFSINQGDVTTTSQNAYLGGIVALQESGGYTLNTVNVGMLKYNAYYNNTEITTTVVAGALIGNFDDGILANSAYQRNNITQINGEDESVSSVGAFGVRTSGVLINIDGLEFANIITMTSAEFINNTTINDTSVSNEGDTIDSNVLNINGEYAQFSKETGQAPTIVWVLASSSD